MDRFEGYESEIEMEEKYTRMKGLKAMGLWFAYGKRPQKLIPSSWSPQKMIFLESSEGETFEVEETVALESLTIKELLEENPYDRTIPFPCITSEIMDKVIKYLKRHVEEAKSSSDLKEFDAEFVKVDRATLSALGRASVDLQCKSLHDLISQTSLAELERGKTPKMSSKEIIEALAVGGVESMNEMRSGLLSVASTHHTHAQNDEMLKLTRGFFSEFRSSMYMHGDKFDRDSSDDLVSTPQNMIPSSWSPQKMILLESSDGETFEVEETVALESLTIEELLEDDPDDRTIPCPRITSKIMPKVIEYLKRHVEAKSSSSGEDLKEFDAEFVKVDRATLDALRLASVDLQCKSLHNLISQTSLAAELRGKTPKMSSKEILEAVGGVESLNEMRSRLLSVASTHHTHPQNDEMLKLTRGFFSEFRSSKYMHGDKFDRDSLNLSVTKKRGKEELSDDSKDKRQKAGTQEE